MRRLPRSIDSISRARSTAAERQHRARFTAERLAAGATMLRDMIYTAWLDSAQL